MRINRFVATATGLSRRAADRLIESSRVVINGETSGTGREVTGTDTILLDNKQIRLPETYTSITLNKPRGYVCSREGQGSKTIYDLLPTDLHSLKPVGRLDKDSSGLLLMTNDGELAQRLTHPSFQKMKSYEVTLDKPLTPAHLEHITKKGVVLDDGQSKFELRWLEKNNGNRWVATLHEGRNRQIRRTFAALGYNITKLHRTRFGDYTLRDLKSGKYSVA